jgi:hypothetical protein
MNHNMPRQSGHKLSTAKSTAKFADNNSVKATAHRQGVASSQNANAMHPASHISPPMTPNAGT